MDDGKAQRTHTCREKVGKIVDMRQLYQQALLNGGCVNTRQLAVGGKGLMGLEMKPGREHGSMLSELLEYVIDDPERNKKEILCAYVKEKLGL